MEEPKDYYQDLEKWQNSFYCGCCGMESNVKDFTYQRTVANGEVYDCKSCGGEVLVDNEPVETDYFY